MYIINQGIRVLKFFCCIIMNILLTVSRNFILFSIKFRKFAMFSLLCIFDLLQLFPFFVLFISLVFLQYNDLGKWPTLSHAKQDLWNALQLELFRIQDLLFLLQYLHFFKVLFFIFIIFILLQISSICSSEFSFNTLYKLLVSNSVKDFSLLTFLFNFCVMDAAVAWFWWAFLKRYFIQLKTRPPALLFCFGLTSPIWSILTEWVFSELWLGSSWKFLRMSYLFVSFILLVHLTGKHFFFTWTKSSLDLVLTTLFCTTSEAASFSSVRIGRQGSLVTSDKEGTWWNKDFYSETWNKKILNSYLAILVLPNFKSQLSINIAWLKTDLKWLKTLYSETFMK